MIDLTQEPFKKVYSFIKKNPGESFESISGKTGLGYGVVLNTLHTLAVNDHILFVRNGYQIKAVIKQ